MKNKKLFIGLWICLILILVGIPVFSRHSATTSMKESLDPVLMAGEKEKEGEVPSDSEKYLSRSEPGQKRKPKEDLPESSQEKGKSGQQDTPGPFRFRLDWSALDLSPEQKAQIRQKRREFVIATSTLREKLRFAKADLGDAVSKTPLNPDKIKELTNQTIELESQLVQLALRNLLEIKKILTPAQVDKLPFLASDFARRWKDLDLTPDQLTKLSGILREFIPRRREIDNRVQLLTGELRDLFIQPTTDPKRIEKIAQELIQAKKEQAQLRAEFIIKSREILTPSQLEKLATLSPPRSQRFSSQSSEEPSGEDKGN
jgi:Spy/CpxP family protein refolding chaperone